VLDVGQVIDAIASLVGEISGRRRLDQVGIAISGDVDTDRGLVVLSPLLGWQDVDFADRLAGAVRLPVIIDNDIRALTVAERSFGDAFGIDNFAVVTIGEGIGCGLVIGGRVLRGAFGVAGELGHMIIDAAAAPATLTADGVPGLGQVEQLISRAGVVRRAGTVTGKAVGTVAELIRLVGDGDARVAELLTTIGRELGLTVANLVNLTGPQRLVISSEGFDLDAAFGPALDATIRMHAFGQAAQVEIIHREIPFTEWARGAAVVALNQRVAQIC
jgi:predicted NBD/HSP70 family sugar kinase